MEITIFIALVGALGSAGERLAVFGGLRVC